jgi:hypothetical protein
MKAGMLVRVRPDHPSAGNMGLILECGFGEDAAARVQWFDGSIYWINTQLLEEVRASDKKLEKNT